MGTWISEKCCLLCVSQRVAGVKEEIHKCPEKKNKFLDSVLSVLKKSGVSVEKHKCPRNTKENLRVALLKEGNKLLDAMCPTPSAIRAAKRNVKVRSQRAASAESALRSRRGKQKKSRFGR